MAAWKYSVSEIDLNDEYAKSPKVVIKTMLDLVTARGWELVSIVPSPLDSSKLFVVVKRPKRQGSSK